MQDDTVNDPSITQPAPDASGFVRPEDACIPLEREAPETAPAVPDNPTLATYSNETIAKAYELYVSTDASLSDVALQLSVPVKKVAFWARQFEWKARKAELERQVLQAVEAEHRDFLVKNKMPTIKRHLEAATEAELLTLELLKRMRAAHDANQKINPADLKRLTEALSSATGVSARAVGLSDQPAIVPEHGSQRQPMIMVGVMPLPASAEKVIDVDSE